jgi:hypothetical protein
MEQKEFTDYIIPKILDRFPRFAEFCINKPGNVIDVEYKSSQGKLTLWITTQDREITAGFTGDTDCDWHCHMSSLGANKPDEEFESLTELINGILNDQEPIVYSNLHGYSLTEDINEVDKDLDVDEKIRVFKWSEL